MNRSTPFRRLASINLLILVALAHGSQTSWANPQESVPSTSLLATEVACDNQSACFSKYESGGAGSWGYVPSGNIGSSGAYNAHAYWTYNENNPIDWGKWQPSLPTTGNYDVSIWYPHFPGVVPETNTAHYQVHHAGGDEYVTWNQAVDSGKWNKIATVSCAAGAACYVKLTDATSEGTGSRRVWFDAVKFTLVETPNPGDTTMPDGTITAPQEGQTINASALTFSADAWDNAGGSGVGRVEFNIFYNNAWRNVGTSYHAPYYVRWTPPAGLGSQQIRFAIHVIDNAGNRHIDPGGIRNVNFKSSQAVDNGFKLPYPGGVGYQVTQGNDSAFSHYGQWTYAFDFGMPSGRDVVAARNGRVVAVKSNSNQGGCSSWYINSANYVLIRHLDGSESLYVHLDNVAVSNGATVQRGQVIGRSGQTGWSCGAHLHFERRNAGQYETIPTSFLDVSGGVPQYGRWYTSGNYVGLASDSVAPVGEVQFRLTGSTPSTLSLLAEDDTTLLNGLEMRMADSADGLASAAWQPFVGEITWDQPTVWVQYRDQAGNISDSYADTLDSVATSPVKAAFSTESTVCANTEVPIVNQTTPFCAQCQWNWDLGNGVTSIASELAPTTYSAGTYTIRLSVSGANNTNTATQQVTVLTAPDATFTLTRSGNTVTVTAKDSNATAWTWDFGDGATASGLTATHTYASIATGVDAPVIHVTAQGANSCTGEASAVVGPEDTHTVYLPLIRR